MKMKEMGPGRILNAPRSNNALDFDSREFLNISEMLLCILGTMYQCSRLAVLVAVTLGMTQGLNIKIDLSRAIAKVEPEFISVTIDCLMLVPPKWQTFSFR